ncbi:hypothetical protein AB0K02_27130 [Streptomyces sp. NPDC049597]|uniref:hypothetical protein n=1 Tax=Streptomyces sp. NPDC049597 TaxID=3155276 RepID=UPI003446A5DE
MIVESLVTQEAMPITAGRNYGVYGLAQYASRAIVLVRSDDDRPNWCPLEWFRVVDGHIPGDWEFSVVDPTGSALQLLFGYPELVNDPDHYDGLLERDPRAISVFREIAVTPSEFSAPSDEEFLSNFGVVPSQVGSSSRFSIELEDPTGRAILLQWDSMARTAQWSLLTGREVVAEEALVELNEVAIYCENQESGLILRAGAPPGRNHIRMRIYPAIRAQTVMG